MLCHRGRLEDCSSHLQTQLHQSFSQPFICAALYQNLRRFALMASDHFRPRVTADRFRLGLCAENRKPTPRRYRRKHALRLFVHVVSVYLGFLLCRLSNRRSHPSVTRDA